MDLSGPRIIVEVDFSQPTPKSPLLARYFDRKRTGEMLPLGPVEDIEKEKLQSNPILLPLDPIFLNG